MRIRPARAVRSMHATQPWSRYSISKPRKNYVKSMPHTSLLIFNMGKNKKGLDLVATLESEQDVQLRSNALEAARQVSNKHLERELQDNYHMRVITFPHHVIREKKMATGAGADRISKGMTLAFGKASSVAARVHKGQKVFEVKVVSAKRDVAMLALKRAASKLSGTYKIRFSQSAS